MKRLLQLKERKKVLLQQRRELVKDYQRIREEIKEIIKEIKDEESTDNYQHEFTNNYQEKSNQNTGIGEEDKESSDKEVEEPCEQHISTEEEIEEQTSTKRKHEEIICNEQTERMEKRQKRIMNKEEEIQKIIENEQRQEAEEEEETNHEVMIYQREITSMKDGAEMYKLAEKRTRTTMKMWLKYAKWFENEVRRKKDNDPTISERMVRGRVYDEMMKYLTSEKGDQKRIRENLRKQTTRALDHLKLYKKQLKNKKDEQKANELKGIIQDTRIEMLELY